MGIVYSTENILLNNLGNIENISSINLNLSSKEINDLISCYVKFQYPSMLDSFNFHSFFMNAKKIGKLSENDTNLIIILWNLYQVNSICYIQEVLGCLILLSNETWYNRLSLLFDLFKCAGNDEVAYDDILLACQIIVTSLHKLWSNYHTQTNATTIDWDYAKWNCVIETVVDDAYTKLGKDIDSYITKEEFLNWSLERFKESRSIATSDSLYKLYSTSYD